MRRVTRAVLVLATVLTVSAGCGDSGANHSATTASRFSPQGRAAARHFLDTYVGADGAVVRHDQGDDVVSEGQAYGMVIAELVGDDGAVHRIWSWTKVQLRRPDGLLSFHADQDGSVLDPESAADADVLAAYALLRYDGQREGDLHHDGATLAAAVLDHETAPVGDDGAVTTAGSWVRGEPAIVNPSYWMPGVAHGLADLTGDERWDTMADTMVRLTSDLTDGGRRLPPDWARLDRGRVEAVGAPDGSRAAQYGPDAQRVPAFFSVSCAGHAEQLAAQWWGLVRAPDRSAALALGLDGRVVDGTRAPLALLASAAAAGAAGDDHAAAALVGAATEQTRVTPTYYGDAWLALAAGLVEGRFGC